MLQELQDYLFFSFFVFVFVKTFCQLLIRPWKWDHSSCLPDKIDLFTKNILLYEPGNIWHRESLTSFFTDPGFKQWNGAATKGCRSSLQIYCMWCFSWESVTWWNGFLSWMFFPGRNRHKYWELLMVMDRYLALIARSKNSDICVYINDLS